MPTRSSGSWMPLARWRVSASRFLPLQGRHKRVVPRPRTPQYPALEPGVVDRLLLSLDLLGAIGRLTERESLNPRSHVLGFFQPELLVPDPRRVQRDLEDVVGVGVRARDAE